MIAFLAFAPIVLGLALVLVVWQAALAVLSAAGE